MKPNSMSEENIYFVEIDIHQLKSAYGHLN